MFGKTKEPVVPVEIIVPTVSKVGYVEVGMKMSNGKTEKGYRLVCPCGNHRRDKYGNYVKTIVERDERKRLHTTKVMGLLCKVCNSHDIILTDFQEQYNAIIQNKDKPKIKA